MTKKRILVILMLILGGLGLVLPAGSAFAEKKDFFSKEGEIGKTEACDNLDKLNLDDKQRTEYEGYCRKKSGNGDEDKVIAKVQQILNIIYFWVGIVAVVIIIAGGIMLSVSMGNPQQIEKGKKMIIGAVVGLVITLSAFAITYLIVKALGG